MAGVAKQAVIVSLSRFANFGLMLISPIVLVRLLSVRDFGLYREFLVYSGVLLSFATFGIAPSLLYFVPRRPEHTWQFVKLTIYLTAVTSSIVVLVVSIADIASGGAVVGRFLVPLVIYTLVFANIDFWEFLWLATNKPMAVFAYTSGRLVARMLTVVVAAYFLKTVTGIIWSLIALETVRLVACGVSWLVSQAEKHESSGEGWRGMMSFCLPNGGSLLLGIMNRYSANIIVAKVMGPVALAHYTIGTYVEPIVSTLRNSLSDAMLPAMVNRSNNSIASSGEAVLLWQRGTVVASILLLPIGALLARYADTLIVTAFSPSYRSAVPVLQVFLLVLIRECFDFAVALKTINQTRYFLYGDVAALVLNLILLAILMPLAGLVGAVGAYVISSFAEGAYLCRWVTRLYKIPVRSFVPWREFSKVALATIVAIGATYGGFLTDRFGFVGVVLGSVLFGAVYVLMLRILHVEEARKLMDIVLQRASTYVRLLAPGR